MANLSPDPEVGDKKYPKLAVVNKGNTPMAIEQIKSTAAGTATVAAKEAKTKKKTEAAEGAEAEAEKEPEPEPLLMPDGKISEFLDDEISSIPLRALVPIDDPEHPLYDPRAEKVVASQEFLDSFKEQGQLEPGIVFPLGNGKFVVLAGNQRVAGLRHAGIDRFKARTAKPEIGDMGAVYLQIATNALRTDDSLEARGKRMKHMLKLNGGNVLATAKAFGVTKETVRNAIKLQEADASVRKAVADGIIKETTAVQLVTGSAGDKEKQKKAIQKAREMSEKLGNAKVATGIKAKKGKVGKAPKAIPAAALMSRKPSQNLIRELASAANFSKETDTVLQWILGELDSETLVATVPAVKKVWNKLENRPNDIA